MARIADVSSARREHGVRGEDHERREATDDVVELAAANVVVRASKAACPESVASRVRSDVALACSRTSREWARASLGSSSRRTEARN